VACKLVDLDFFECELEMAAVEPLLELLGRGTREGEPPPRLRMLHLGNNQLGDAVLRLTEPLARLPQLKQVILGHRDAALAPSQHVRDAMLATLGKRGEENGRAHFLTWNSSAFLS